MFKRSGEEYAKHLRKSMATEEIKEALTKSQN